MTRWSRFEHKREIRNAEEARQLSRGRRATAILTFTIFLRNAPPSVQEFGVPFMETSAKSGLNVELAFTAAAK